MKEGRKPEYPEKTPDDELQKTRMTNIWTQERCSKNDIRAGCQLFTVIKNKLIHQFGKQIMVSDFNVDHQ